MWTRFHRLGDVLLASAVVGLPVSAGYAGRGGPAYQAEICRDQGERFQRHELERDVLYVTPSSIPAAYPELACVPLPDDMAACRLA